jgi:hypothetical protein
MSTRTVKIGTLAFAALGAFVLCSSQACDEPKPKCNIGRGDFTAKYTYVSGPDTCKETKGDTLGLQAYNAVGTGGRPNLDVGSIAIRSLTLGTLAQNADGTSAADPDPTHHPHAFGNFTTAEPDDDDFCYVPTLQPAVQNLGLIPADPDNEIDEQPATQQSYAWSNVKVYVTAGVAGTQFTADLVLTVDGTACTYKVQAMYPAVPCTSPDPNDKTKVVTDDSACDSQPDPDHDRPTGSGILPDFPVSCNADLGACFLTSDKLPALK